MQITISKISNLVHGHVLDVNKKHFTRVMHNFNKDLYIKWNPRKNKGNGLWELWHRPEQKTAVFKTEYNGSKIYELEYVPNMLNHVLDMPFLEYGVFSRLVDTWEDKNYVDGFEYREAKLQEEKERKFEEERRYNIRHHRKIFGDLQKEMQSGQNIFRYFKGIK